MRTNEWVGRTVALVGCRAYRHGTNEPHLVTGLFELVEYLPYEPSNYVHEPQFIVIPDGAPDDTLINNQEIYITAEDLWPQLDPKGYGRHMAQKHKQELAEEEAAAKFANLFE